MANEGHVIIKKQAYREHPRPHLIFFSKKVDVDKNGNPNNRPAWQMPRHVESLQENVNYKKKALEDGFVPQESIKTWKTILEKEEKRLCDILESKDASEKIINDDREFWQKKYKEMGDKISQNTPTETDYHKKRPNPHKIANMEKSVFEDGMTFQQYKSAWQCIGRALDEDSNIANLVRDI
uniref:Uncharacterized protein n=1 Tax=viral metagenome TaxID=1070528 RepID=A0A6M3JBR3_9ZZZZ